MSLSRTSSFAPAPMRSSSRDSEPAPAQLIDHYLAENWILTEDWDRLPLNIQESLLFAPNRAVVLEQMVGYGL